MRALLNCRSVLVPFCLAFVLACSSDEPNPPADSGVADTGPEMDGGPTGMTLYQRVGGATSVTNIVNDFLARVSGDVRINAYFLNSSVDGTRLSTCLVKQLSAAMGADLRYPGPGEPADADGCRNMLDAHAGLGVSHDDYRDLNEHLVSALNFAQIPSADLVALSQLLAPLEPQIVEDPGDDATVYQRVGRKPAIDAVTDDFVGRVLADPAINGYFLNQGVDGARLAVCLKRQICAASGGPCRYGEGLEAELNGSPCQGMVSVHQGLGISARDFDDLIGHLVMALTDAQVRRAELDAIVGIVGGQALRDQIIEDRNNDQTIYQRAGRKPAVAVVISDFVTRVLADPAINGYFLNSSVDPARLTTCLVRQTCALTGGPCVYGEGVEPELSGLACRDMLSSHQGLGISQSDFSDLAGHLVAALAEAGVLRADIDTIVAVLTSSAVLDPIVEDPTNDATIYQRVGRKPAVEIVIEDFVGRVVADAAINGYFLNSSVDADRLSTCLVRQVCQIAAGPCRYGEGIEMELGGLPCRDMLTAHTSLGVSQADYDDLAAHLVSALADAGVLQADIDALAAVLTSSAVVDPIVEDPTNDGTVYQRVGRKPAIGVVVADFAARVFGDVTINGFFNTDPAATERLATCLVRQVCDIDGPCIYGEGVEDALGGLPCRDMLTTHTNLVDVNDASPITIDDFNALVAHLISALDTAGVAAADRDAIVAELGLLCVDIVDGGTGC